MSSHSSVSPDTLVTVKVNYDASTRRFKLALRDLGPSVFQDKLRELLAIPASQEVTFERFSDSAAGWFTLDAQNVPVYKQLFRAAKAKLKLRIRVTNIPTDVPPLIQGDKMREDPLAPFFKIDSTPEPAAAPPTSSTTVVDPTQLDEAVTKAVALYCTGTEFDTHIRATIRDEVEKHTPEYSASVADLISLPKNSEPSEEAKPTPADEHLISAVQNLQCECTLYCNSCNSDIKEAHYHCDQCDQGDFDLCSACVDKGLHCKESSHWLTKRGIFNGKVTALNEFKGQGSRICNCCVRKFEDRDCVVCAYCDDYDLCIGCLRAGTHGHDPRHPFARVDPSMILTLAEEKLLPAGRNKQHEACCDRCDTTIFGIRHKCIDCPDWDYCNDCIKFAPEEHPGHRFVQVSDREGTNFGPYNFTMHQGVFCDGPICPKYAQPNRCIRGIRYKCSICPDTDFCASCEASPSNMHNPSHPLLKFKTPIRNVFVTTTDSTNTIMGDVEFVHSTLERRESTNTATQVQTIADVAPTKEFATLVPAAMDLCGEFVRDSIADGTVMSAGQDFTQTWTMKNVGSSAWPAGISIKFIGGNLTRPKSEEVHATVTESEVKPGEEVDFSVNLSAGWDPRSYTSYWRLTGSDGRLFGDNMWCSIVVKETVVEAKEEKSVESVQDEKEGSEGAVETLLNKSQDSSQMVFPRLPVESPVHSIERLPSACSSHKDSDLAAPASPVNSHKTFALSEDGDAEEVELSSNDGFLTDEEYDVLDASDEEYEECERVAA